MRLIFTILFTFCTFVLNAQVKNKKFQNKLCSIKFDKSKICEKIIFSKNNKHDTIIGKWKITSDTLLVNFNSKKTEIYQLTNDTIWLKVYGQVNENITKQLLINMHLTDEFYDSGIIKKKYLYRFHKDNGFVLHKIKYYDCLGKLKKKQKINNDIDYR